MFCRNAKSFETKSFCVYRNWRQCNKKELIKIEREISDFAPKIGFKVNEILSSDLSKHSRIFNPTYAQKGKKNI